MTAHLDLVGWREPAQVEIEIVALARDRERSLAEVIFGGDRLHHPFVEPFLERHYRGWIAGERRFGECIDLEEGNARHLDCSVISCGSSVSRSVWPSGSTWIRISVLGK